MGYLGAIVGAGFASGQEIAQFFVNYGESGLKGAITATLLFSLCGALLIYSAHKIKSSNYQYILVHLLGRRMGRIIDLLLAVFLYLGISTMLSASGAVFYEHLYLPKNLGIFIAYGLVILMLLSGKRGLISSYNILVPVKVILLIIISGYAAFFVQPPQVESYTYFICPADEKYWLLASILYVAYNFSLAMVVLTGYQSISERKNGIIGAVCGGLLLGMLLIINYIALSKYLPAITHYQVPMLYVAGNISQISKYLYTIVLWVGILTTAIANAYGFVSRVSSFTGLGFTVSLLTCMTLALPVSMQSFSSLVSKVYPIFGIIGILIISSLLYKSIKDMIGELYYKLMSILSRIKEGLTWPI